MTNPSESRQAPEQRHYIVVVHGIGEQRLNVTTTPVVHRFAEARAGDTGRDSDSFNCLVPSYLSSQSVRKGATGYGWSEFSGIPVKTPPPSGPAIPFNGLPASNKDVGENFRFIEFYWADILQRHEPLFGSRAEDWVDALLHRLKDNNTPDGWLPSWAVPLVERVAKTALSVQRLLLLRNTQLAKLIFDDFLGDVHLYGDYARTRGEVVRRFHLMLDETIIRDFLAWRWHQRRDGVENPVYVPPEFTIIAHSLGSIMCFDALMYAYAKAEVRRSENPNYRDCPSVPFLGYTDEDASERRNWEYLANAARYARDNNVLADVKDLPPVLADKMQELASWADANDPGTPAPAGKPQSADATKSGSNPRPRIVPPTCPPLLWRNHIRNFVTLGSPIDKYVVLWWNKYLHMGLQPCVGKTWNNGVNDWLDEKVLNDKGHRRIEHFNLCDQQDPVGHHLEVARKTLNYDKVFNAGNVSERDAVFQRYGHPGLAHTCYWEDSELFRKIVTEIIDGKQTPGAFTNAEFASRKSARWWPRFWYVAVFAFAFAVTAGLAFAAVRYGKNGDTVRAVIAGAAAVLLWVKPRMLDYISRGGPFSPKLGILGNLCLLVWAWAGFNLNPVEGKAEEGRNA